MVPLLAALAACGGGGDGGPTSAGSIAVAATTTGASPDLDGYQVSVDGGVQVTVGSNAELVLSVATGPHDLSIEGVAANCAASLVAPRRVTVTAGDTTRLALGVNCPAPIAGPGIFARTGTSSWTPDTSQRVVLLDPVTGTGPETKLPVGGLMRLSPGRGQVAFTAPSPSDPAFQLWTMNVDGSDARAILPDSGIQSWPLAWSPDGRQLVLWSGKSGGGVATVYADGSGFRFLGPRGQVIGALPNTRADWSPDGRTIAFIDVPAQFSVGITGYDPVTRVFRPIVLPTTKNLCCLRWSPNGQWLAFGRVKTVDSTVVFRVSAAGGPLDSVTTVNNLSSITWSPGNDQLLLEIGVQPSFLSDLFAVDTNGAGVHDVTNTPLSQEEGASWLP